MRRGDGHELGIDVGDDNGRPCGPAHRRVEQNTVVRVPHHTQVPAGASQVTFPTHMITLMAGSGVGRWRAWYAPEVGQNDVPPDLKNVSPRSR